MKPKDPEKIDLIYAATLKLVKQHGLAGLNMAAIGKECALGMGTIYVYFKSKEVLVNSLFKTLKQLNTDRIYEAMDEQAAFKKNLKTLVLNYIKNRIDFYEEHFFIEQCSNSYFLDAASRKLDDAAYTGVYALLNRGKAEMLVKGYDNAILASAMIGTANELVNMWMRHKQKPGKKQMDEAFELCWDCIQR